jgi:hypothetical protein
MREGKPWWWDGTPEEWNLVPEGDRVEHRALPVGAKREGEAARLLAIVRNEQFTPASDDADGITAPQKKVLHLVGIRNWTTSVDGIKAERIRNCIIYLLDIKKDTWYINNCNNRAFVERFASKMDAQVPENFVYDPDAVLASKRRHIDGENEPVIQVVVNREPGSLTDKERKDLRDGYGVSDATILYLAKKDCPLCHGKSFVDVSDYPEDPLHSVLTHSEPCKCVWE